MSGYDKVKPNSSISLMGNRLSLSVYKPKENSTDESSTTNSLEELEGQKLLLRQGGGYTQRERMIFDKRRSLDRALKYSYQSAKITKVQCVDDNDNTEFEMIHTLDEHDSCWALINPDKTKMDYDDKIVSVHYEENYHPGDVFKWEGTNSYWMVYLQDLTEVAYFRGEIRRCSYQISWVDEDGNTQTTYAAVRGPVETKINYIQKHGISVDTPNHSLDIYLPRNEETLKYFRRYSKFYLKGMDAGSPIVCWRVEATDWISTPGILEMTAVEYYANETEDDIENGVVGGLIVDPVDPNPEENPEGGIEGDTFIKPKKVYKYTYTGLNAGHWSIEGKNPAKFKVNETDPREVYIRWDSSYSGQFVLCWGNESKTIVVESLF